MRLAFLTHEPFYPPSGGGSAEAVYLVQELRRRGHEVEIFCPAIPDASFVTREFGVQVHEFKTWRMGRYTSLRSIKYLLYPIFLQRLVAAQARATRFDLVFSQHAISAVTAGRVKQRLGLPVVMNFLDYLTGFMETWPAYLAPPRLIAALEKYELSLPLKHQAGGVLTVSDTLADYFAGAGYPRDRILPIYYGYDSKVFVRREPDSSTATRPPVVVMHGSFDHHHLGPIARQAVVHVARARPNVVFRFVGKRTPALEKFLGRVHSEIPDANIECAGFIPYAEIARHLSEGSVGIVPYEESTGTHCAFVAKIVEYLALGLPVVSTPLKSARRYFHDEPLTRFSKFEGPHFGECILAWLQEPLDKRQSLGRAASARVKAELDWPVICGRAIDFVEKIHRETRRSGNA